MKTDYVHLPLKILLKETDQRDGWLAISLERYIVGQGNTLLEAWEQFGVSLCFEIVLGLKLGKSATQPLAGIQPAPSRYWDMYETAQPEEMQDFSFPTNENGLPTRPKIEGLRRLAEAA